jgi:hypothetical protein
MMSAPSAQLPLPLSISSAEDSPARTCLAQERARALLESARACGVSSLAWSGSSARGGSSLRTSRAVLDDGSMRSFVSWNSSAMRAYLSRCRRAMSALLTCESDSSLLPTVTIAGNYNRKGASANSGDGLITALKMLPTLTVCQRDNSGGEYPGAQRPSLETLARNGLLPTLLATAEHKGGDTYGRGNLTLHGALKRLPTLTTRDEKGPGPAAKSKGGRDLPATLGGHLNPDWCRWFMGFAAGWLDVDDVPAFARSGTRSFRSAPKSSAG